MAEIHFYCLESLTVRADDAGWDEHKHPRDPDGKFVEGVGGGPAVTAKGVPIVPYPAHAINKIMKSYGYKKGKVTPGEGEHLTTYEAPNGNLIHIHHPPEGQAASSKWTSELPGHEPKTGAGTTIEDLLKSLAERQKAKEAPKEVAVEEKNTEAQFNVAGVASANGFNFVKNIASTGSALFTDPISGVELYIKKDGTWELYNQHGEPEDIGKNAEQLKTALGVDVAPVESPALKTQK